MAQDGSNTAAGVREGDVIADKYRIERVLGAGGMGIVVAASHLQLQQRVAIKFLLPGVVSGPESIARFLREARAAARIQSEHVARVLDAATMADGTPYMVMEFLEGRDLAALLEQRGTLPLEEAVGYMLQACEGIAEAHAVGIVHRDLKPSNFFLCDRGGGRTIVKVLDFGVSKVGGASQAEVSLTSSSAFLGSPLYMSPEQMASAKHVDQRADIWSLGVTLFELVSGKPPFGGESVTEVIASVLQRPPLSLREIQPHIAPGFDSALGRSLEKDRERRYSNVAEFAAAIAPFGPRHAALTVERISGVLGGASTLASPGHGLAATSEASSAPSTVPPQPSFGHDATAAAVRVVGAVTPGVGGTTSQPVSDDRANTFPSAGQSVSRKAPWGALGAVVAIAGLGGAALMVKRPGSETGTASTAQAVSPPISPSISSWPSASIPAPVVAASAPPVARLPEPAAMPDAPPAASTATSHRQIAPHPGASAPSPPPSASKGGPTAPAPGPAAAPSCRVVQYFDAEGEARFRRECP